VQVGIRGYRYKARENKSDKDRVRIQKRARKLSRVGVSIGNGSLYTLYLQADAGNTVRHARAFHASRPDDTCGDARGRVGTTFNTARSGQMRISIGHSLRRGMDTHMTVAARQIRRDVSMG
jgi:hypothetical protein